MSIENEEKILADTTEVSTDEPQTVASDEIADGDLDQVSGGGGGRISAA